MNEFEKLPIRANLTVTWSSQVPVVAYLESWIRQTGSYGHYRSRPSAYYSVKRMYTDLIQVQTRLIKVMCVMCLWPDFGSTSVLIRNSSAYLDVTWNITNSYVLTPLTKTDLLWDLFDNNQLIVYLFSHSRSYLYIAFCALF